MARLGIAVAALAAVLGLGGAVVANQVDARRHLDGRVRALTGGDPDAGRAIIAQAPCGGCHEIPGVRGANGRVGPPLTHFAARAFIAGRVNNTPDNLVRWVQDPHTIDAQNAMPPMGLSEAQARDVAAYLETLG